MRVLFVGAGATGGYFGGRLLQHGRDVTFLVRERRAEQLARHGLVIHSRTGDVTLPTPPTVLARELHEPFDLVVLSCKAYGLEQAMEDFAPAVGPHTTILPLLNGMRHMDRLDARFGADKVLAGQCSIAATLDDEGAIRHLNTMQNLVFGERDGRKSERMQAITKVMLDAGFDAHASDDALQAMWNKWVFLASLAGITCLMRASVADIMAAPGGAEATLALLEDCRATAERAGHAPSDAALGHARSLLTDAQSSLTASMLRDLQQGHPIEADHVIGDMLARSGHAPGDGSMLAVAYAHLKAYEAGRARRQTN
ncbi:2-dehydropantoate 2-reductase [Rhodanobacter glycinis]|uniref:2-dehydropantoate 2-reductase n=2 Tax=Rhodanobacter TaxID=75309 RepID=A0A5B9DZ50_9GAMM|nr:2-dehydropantoate 2-reductase [Rhodanobacter glycinis]QEE24025.1 2-dehydropantoate 2-reductase [Rhodanobacter glycinis]